jgi:hypothetical protein
MRFIILSNGQIRKVMTSIEDVANYADRLFERFATSEEVLNHLKQRIETVKQAEFDFDELDNQFEFLNNVRKYIVNKSKFE